MPELWNSSISSKKTIAIREINMIPQQYNLRFRMYWKVELSDTKKYNGFIKYDNTISNEDKTGEVLSDVKTYIDNVFANYTENDGELVNTIRFLYFYDETDNTYSFGIHSSQIEKSYPHASISFKIVDFLYGDSTLGSESWNRLMNQPLEKPCDYANIHTYKNVWNKLNLYFHASFVPYDNYQYIGAVKDIWYKPIIYQYTNASPIFKIWTTIDMINPLIILHEKFYVRLSFVLSSDDKYD